LLTVRFLWTVHNGRNYLKLCPNDKESDVELISTFKNFKAAKIAEKSILSEALNEHK